MATKLKVVDPTATEIAPPPPIPDFEPVPTRKRYAGWTAERQRIFIERLSLTGNVGEACALAGLSSNSFSRLCNKAGADSLVKAYQAARVLAGTRGSALAWDRAVNGRVERFYKNGELVMERRIPSDYLLTWLLSRLDPLTFGSPAAKAHALANGDPREKARAELPQLLASLTDVSPEDCECDAGEYIDERLGEMADGKVAPDEG
ncbi:MAG TPA: hypothetical protein VKC17_07050 [Sphingomicrobium sp.]|nr:hypothetical protein [Sphingomicrobium sp.]